MLNFCPNCGAKIEGNGRFCMECGAPLESPGSSPGTPQPAREPAKAAAASPQGVRQPSGPAGFPQQPQQSQPPYPQQGYPQQPYQQQSYAPPKREKKKGIPLFLKIIIGVVLAFALIIGGIVIFARVAMGNAQKADTYEVGGEEIASVKLALGEERQVTGVSSSTENGVSKYAVTYAVIGGSPGEDMLEYVTYLQEEEGFLRMTDYDFTKPTGSAIQLGREAQEDGYLLVVQIDYDREGYTVTAMRGKGTLEAADEEEEAEPTGTGNTASSALSEPPEPPPGSSSAASSTPPMPGQSSGSIPIPNPGLGSGAASVPGVTLGGDPLADADLIRWMSSGNYYIEFTQLIGGQDAGNGIMAMETDPGGSRRGAFVVPDGSGGSIFLFVDDSTTYFVDEPNETIMAIEGMDQSEIVPEADMSGAVTVASGQGEIGGRTLPYTEYQPPDGSAVRYYFDNGQVYAFGSAESQNYIVIMAQSERAPAGTYDMPDYQIVDASQYMNQLG